MIVSAPFQIRVTPEYLSPSLEQSGSTITSIDVTRTDPVFINVQKI
jgi:hypothetical protein